LITEVVAECIESLIVVKEGHLVKTAQSQFSGGRVSLQIGR